jgi:hypothetical protein
MGVQEMHKAEVELHNVLLIAYNSENWEWGERDVVRVDYVLKSCAMLVSIRHNKLSKEN